MIFFSCKQEINLSIPNSAPVLVIQGEITTEKDSSYLNITKTVSYFSSDPIPTIDSAVVSVNGITFKPKGNGIYKPDTSFAGTINTQYNLSVTYQGVNYTSTSFLDPMFNIDSVDSFHQPARGPRGIDGYTVRFWWTDTRTPGKFTYIRYGKNSADFSQDSFFRNIVLMDNSLTKLNTQLSYNIGRSYQPGDTVFAILKSCDYNMYYFLQAYKTQTSSPPGPFQTPPANLPTNIRGGALGYFVASDVRRFKKGL